MNIGTIETFPDGNEYKLMNIKRFTKGKLIGFYELWHRRIKKTGQWTKNPSFLMEVNNNEERI